MKIFLSLLLLLNIIRAEVIFDKNLPPVKEEIIDYDSVQPDENDEVPQEELKKNSQQILEDVIETKHTIQQPKKHYAHEQNLYLSVKNQPRKAILSQRVDITLKATVTRDDVEGLKTDFSQNSSYRILNKNASWQKKDENTYLVTYYLQYLSTKPKQPVFTVDVKYQDGTRNKNSIKLKPVKVVALKSDEYFCKVIADTFVIKSHTQKRYDDNNNIVLIEIDANNSNLGDFSLSFAKKSGVDEYIDKGFSQKAFAYAIVDRRLKKFKFKYFDLKTNHYKMVSFDIILKDQTLSTQTELNPQKNKFKLYKTIALLVVAFVLLLIVLKNRSVILGAVAVAILLYTAYVNFPLKTVTLQKGEGLKILPTQNSTVFYIVPHKTDAVVVYENKKFYKVVLPDNKHIGWVKKDDK